MNQDAADSHHRLCAELIPRLREEEAKARGLRSIHEEGRRLLKLVEELLALSRLGRTGFSVTDSEAPLAPLVREAGGEVAPFMQQISTWSSCLRMTCAGSTVTRRSRSS